ncbi:prepilin-type N-terminal cleavage/methylation domain-containing protein [Candidatus Nomurabacteria bacterium]|nr:prepilin-type N-terminal cleavage/methylation domain-containing protein [Candidatus Nomurabacteria bacterium]
MLFLRTKKAFTVVELLLVVVVIVILSSIILVSWQSSREKAENSQTAAAVRVFKDALEMYALDHGRYPDVADASKKACLGLEYSIDRCWRSGSEYVLRDNAFNNSLQSVYKDKLLMPSTKAKAREGAIFEGVRDTAPNTVDGKVVPVIAYSIKGNGACPVGPVLSRPDQSALLTFSSQPPVGGVTRPATATEPALCYISLPAID